MNTWRIGQTSRLTSKNLILLTLVSLILGVLAWYFTGTLTVKLIEYSYPPIGAPCLSNFYLYDGNGKRYSEVPGLSVSYSGQAPLFDVGTSRNDADGCPIFPDSVSPDIAQKSTTIYPLLMELLIPADRIKSGESIIITTTAQVLNYFPDPNKLLDNQVLFTFPFTANKSLEAYFILSTTTFDYSPEEGAKVTLSLNKSITQRWVISPKENSRGPQSLSISLQADRLTNASADARLEVRPVTGLSPTLIAIITAIGSFLIGALGILKLIPDTYSSYKQLQKKRTDNQNTSVSKERNCRNCGYKLRVSAKFCPNCGHISGSPDM
jgi:hypothetical protein